MKKLEMLMHDIRQWSDATFGNSQRNPAIAYHLKREIDELIEALHKELAYGIDESIGVGEYARQIEKTKFEFADCFMLLLDSASHFGLSAEELIEFTYKKLAINKQRKWGKPDKNGVVEHIKEEQK